MTPTASLLQAVSQFVAPKAIASQPTVAQAATVKAAPPPQPTKLKKPLPADGPPDVPTRRGTYLDVTAGHLRYIRRTELVPPCWTVWRRG